MEEEALMKLYVQLNNELEEIQNASLHAMDEHSADRLHKIWELKLKQIMDIEVKMRCRDYNPKELKKLRKELGLDENSGI